MFRLNHGIDLFFEERTYHRIDLEGQHGSLYVTSDEAVLATRLLLTHAMKIMLIILILKFTY